ncbi:hypothetical protein COS31_03015 [Candidatus Roizmanbacteria bacterium CG02_land_8_20_14_3_00_36_15]|uniref:Big-1 domain-containing protein n=2 Tax=Candidatus Roizmaniibacteriota TaxID=1752723 RepID=A0A2M8KL48_9BACT|nr:MAG: hypothetical protein COS51_04635 [Candidatus Roizmanbacteria bacterium CG03_land_8_20_14_0_80_36_21]PIV37769.1 MAG: hypothetical protein COS31_03015 [Candidatus Roizmanbacteria bacterium CG02_land_8_20_14_3_00_36_15]PIY69561.1 MAG: hypothetical protein COY89_05725 [Candidatus Roizmanbacteria bacterium CG_4_10_14_0_8_um_filter_36_36]PJA52913.1 MAG: hypothetical protein CO166_03810 [Candidatus Roizmanbacteria bacterium CG_4_9_14_3_um_filter_36_11]PJC82292.1 MAG: hypothetical protein CO007
MKKNIGFLLLILFIFIVFSGFFWLYEAKFIVGRASVSQASFSIDNSYLFFTPLQARAGNGEKIRLTVFVLNNQGLGVLGKSTVVGQDPSLTVEGIQPQTDSFGKAIFDVSASKAGEYFLEVKVDGQILPQKAHLSFY